jgi:adenylosuccinate lyase
MNKPTTPDALLLNPLTALSPLDGRYESKTAALRPFFSEYGLIRRRVLVEIRWLLALGSPNRSEVASFSPATKKLLEGIIANFSESGPPRQGDRKITNHDVRQSNIS